MRENVPAVLYTFGGGRLGNQLIRFAHWLAWVEEHRGRVGVINAGFWPYAHLFSHWNEHRGCGYPKVPGWAGLISRGRNLLPGQLARKADRRLLHGLHALGGRLSGWQKVGSLEHLAEIDLAGSAFVQRVEAARITTCAGWRIACWELFSKHDAFVRKMLAPEPRWSDQAGTFVASLRERSSMVVGVLIRQTDYRTWNGGKFYFPTDRYVGWMRDFRDRHPGERICFLVTSDEIQDPREFTELDVTFSSGSANLGGPAFSALMELAHCDAILAPPTTFAAWASHWGRVPYWPLIGEMPGCGIGLVVEGDLNVIRLHESLSAAVK